MPAMIASPCEGRFGRLDSPLGDRLLVCTVITFVQIGVAFTELGEHVVGGCVVAQLAVERGAVAGLDPRLRQIWSAKLTRPRTETLAAAIRRDQAAGAIRADLDADATAIALYAMSEHLLLDLICREGADPQDCARITAPIWEAVHFGHGKAMRS